MLAAWAIALLMICLAGCKRTAPAPQPAATATAPVVFVALPKPTAPLPRGAACVTLQCHASYKTAQHIHGPVAADACQACHDEDQGDHHYPLIRQGNAMCTFCHAVAGTKQWQHKALDETMNTDALMTTPANGQASVATSLNAPDAAGTGDDKSMLRRHVTGGCLTCHDPHISKAKFLLTADTVEGVCEKCHDVPMKKHAHEPFKAGQCTVCHQPHQSDSKALLRYGEGPQHCYGCHKDKEQSIATLPHVHKASAQSCTTCHGPHATDNAKQLKKPVTETCLACHKNVQEELAKAKQVHGAMTQGNCASCHDAHASDQPAELKARTDKVCMTCHGTAMKTADGRTLPGMAGVLASKNLHGPVKNGACSDCHKPHAADQPNLLKKYFPDTFYASFDINNYALCFSCHDQQLVLKPKTTLTNFRDGEVNLHYLHVNRADKGRTCKTCHEVHGSDLPNHMAAGVPFEGSTWSMPIKFEARADGGTCSPGCHAEKTYSRATNAGAAPAGGLK